MNNMEKVKKKEELSWILYDVGNSAFVLIVVTALMPIFFKDHIAFGMSGVESTAKWGFANSAASLTLAVLSPILGAMADYEGKKKRFFLFFLFFGLVFTLGLTTVQAGQWLFCLTIYILARVGWAGANIFYDAFLVDVTSKPRMDMVSAKGYGFGYVGSVVPFLLVLGLILHAGMADGLPVGPVKIGIVIVACWWLLFSLPALKHFKQRHFVPLEQSPVTGSFKRLWQTIKEIRTEKQLFVFLAAYFFYIDGVGTIISMSTAYGRDLGFGVTLLIVVLLFIQLVAFPFALLYGRLAERVGAKKMLFFGIGVYCVATLLAFLLPTIANQTIKVAMFWLIAFLIASAMGGIQALSRSFYTKLIPAEKSAEFFGFYNVFGKFAAITGPALMGGIAAITGESRWGILSILILFILGGLLLQRVNEIEEEVGEG